MCDGSVQQIEEGIDEFVGRKWERVARNSTGFRRHRNTLHQHQLAPIISYLTGAGGISSFRCSAVFAARLEPFDLRSPAQVPGPLNVRDSLLLVALAKHKAKHDGNTRYATAMRQSIHSIASATAGRFRGSSSLLETIWRPRRAEICAVGPATAAAGQ